VVGDRSGVNLDTGASYTLKAQPVGDVNSDLWVTGADSLVINQVLVDLRSFVVSQIIPNTVTTNSPTAVRILGIGFPTNHKSRIANHESPSARR
jgi:hypothetical protein